MNIKFFINRQGWNVFKYFRPQHFFNNMENGVRLIVKNGQEKLLAVFIRLAAKLVVVSR